MKTMCPELLMWNNLFVIKLYSKIALLPIAIQLFAKGKRARALSP